MKKSEIVAEYIKKNPKTPNKTLAKIIMEKSPGLFPHQEAARSAVRAVRGASGKENREGYKKYSRIADAWWAKKDEVPEPHQFTYEPYVIEGARKALLLYDVHIPYHDHQALWAAIQHGKEQGIDTIILAGDIMDGAEVSTFDKDPSLPSLQDEVLMTKQFLQILRNRFPKAKIVYKEGNHEERLSRYIQRNAKALAAFEEAKLPFLLKLADLSIDWIGDKRIIHLGKLSVVHGHEFGKAVFSPVNPARGLYMRSKESAICGHHHQTSEHTEPSLNGDIVTCWSVGALCQLHPQYMPINKWNLGFAIVEVLENGNYRVHNKRIHNGEIL